MQPRIYYPGILLAIAALCFFAFPTRAEILPGELLRAFPGAEGFGACTPGGRGGKVCFVTTLEDYVPGKEPAIPGSLRAAVQASGPRYVLFRVAGTITLKADLTIHEPFITIAGQSAPGGGICLRDKQLIFATHDIIVRHLRVRPGDAAHQDQIAGAIFGGRDLIMDHCSFSWATDEVLSSFGTRNMTVQWSIIAEGLSRSVHPKGEHSKGSILDGDGGITLYHCLYAHNNARNPRVNTVVFDFRNNVIYNWGFRAGYTTSGPCYANYVGNYFKAGPNTTKGASTKLFHAGDDMARVFFQDNLLEGQEKQTTNNALLLGFPKDADAAALRKACVVSTPYLAPEMEPEPPASALDRVLKDCGATLPKRDAADIRLMNEVRDGTGRIIDTPNDVNGWPLLEAGPAPADTDNDGMPDAWETQHQLDPANAADGLRDEDRDGYPNLEEYLNETDPRTPEKNACLQESVFRKAQEEAVAQCARGRQEVKDREVAREAARKVRREELIRTVHVTVTPDIQTAPKTLTLDLGGNATLELVRIPAGSFLMGSPESEGGQADERPQHKVNLSKTFYMATTPATSAQFVAVMGNETRTFTPEEKDCPAKEVNWFEAGEFCELLSGMTGLRFRLPTEAEWEYACRAGTTTAFYTGATITSEQANFDGEKASVFNPSGVYRAKIMPVKSFPPNPWGLYDMPGNQSEYCQDIYAANYTAGEVTDPVCLSGDGGRVMRGGKHGSQAFFLRSACRMSYAPGVGYGFRVVLEVPQGEAR